jgi:beta-lactamase superfamily II metal-dependent hydrolase
VPETVYAGYPAPVMLDAPRLGGSRPKPVQHLLWGDWLRLEERHPSGWTRVYARGEGGWLAPGSVQPNRLLEITMVDVGQGDGCILTTPKDRQILVDAGQRDNMYRYLRWRFNEFKTNGLRLEHAVMTHPDLDHYGGFELLLDNPDISFGALFHNGLVERGAGGKTVLGTRLDVGGKPYVRGLISDEAELRLALADPATRTRRRYASLLWTALNNGRVGSIRGLRAPGFLAGYGPTDEISIEVIAPVADDDGSGNPVLPWFGDDGPTKNGHSVVLMLRYGSVRILLGGDLNLPAEARLLNHYAGGTVVGPRGRIDRTHLPAAASVFGAEIAKACHHGSADFLDVFMEAIRPAATFISSGDEEGYAHPRADALGAIGRTSRGTRPLIFSTELGRSSAEYHERPDWLRSRMNAALAELESASTPAARARALEGARDARSALERSVAIYGAIQLRTDGSRVVIAQKIERPMNKGRKWDVYALEPIAGELTYVPNAD